jgi:hypothetical protein
MAMGTNNALPGVYYTVFGVIEPALMALSFLTSMLDPEKPCANQALPASPLLRRSIHPAAYITLFLAALVEASVAFFIYSRLAPIREGMKKECMRRSLILQEGACKALLVPFAIGDVGAIAVTFYALGWEATEDAQEWSVGVWSVVGLGISLALPRWAWFAGLGRWCSSSEVGERRINGKKHL